MVDTIETAYRKALEARARGRGQVQLTVDADGKRAKRRWMRAFAELPGCDGMVVRRLIDEDGVTTAYVVLVDTVDVLAAYAEHYRKKLETPVVRPRRKRISFSR